MEWIYKLLVIIIKIIDRNMKSLLVSIIALLFLVPNIKGQEKFLYTYKKDGSYFMEVSEKYLQRDILVSTTILQGTARKARSSEMRFGYGGDAVFSDIIRLVKKDNTIQIVRPIFYADEAKKTIYNNFYKSTFPPVLESFIIKSEDKGKYLIDITRFLEDDNSLSSLKGAKNELKLGNYLENRSFVSEVHSYPENINFKSCRTYAPVNSKEDSTPTSWKVGVSWLLLPEKPMQGRLTDSRVGYFSTAMNGAIGRQDLFDKSYFANRWRLEPKSEDIEKYKRGELVEPEKQIVYYIDRATPEYLVPYFIDAVKVWNKAFEKAGFKNAITAKLAPTFEEDSTYSEEDMRYSLISYKASPIPNAYGPMVTDPRSGEVINTHVAIFHSVLQLLQRWYFVMCAASDPQAREYPLSKEIMGKLAASVVTHEVGHTLGLLHDFAGSTIYSADSLRNVNFVRKNGIGASVMDYQRFNYLAQPGDGFKGDDFIPKLGVYDEFAIEWGYRLFPDIKESAEIAKKLEKWVDEKRSQDPRLFFLFETDFHDPRIQSEDCGSDQIVANSLCINNLKIDMSNLGKWNPKDDPEYFVLRKRYLSVLSHYDNCMGHVLKIVGGRYSDNPSRNEKSSIYKPVPVEYQRKAVDFLCKNAFNEPTWLFRKDLMDKTGVDFDTYARLPYSGILIKLILKCTELDRNAQIDHQGYTSSELMNKLLQVLFLSKDAKKALTLYERMLQDCFVTQLTILSENPAGFISGNSSLTKQIMKEIKHYVFKAQNENQSYIDLAHYKSMEDFITVWETGKQKSLLSQN